MRSSYEKAKERALRRRARKTGTSDVAVDYFLAAHPTRSFRVVNGNSWDAPWFIASGNCLLHRDGRVFPDAMAAMQAIPGYKAALMRRYMGDKT